MNGAHVTPPRASTWNARRTLVLRPRTDLVAGTADEILERWLDAVDRQHASDVVVDLSGTAAVDPYGLGVLDFLHGCLARRHLRCLVQGVPSSRQGTPHREALP